MKKIHLQGKMIFIDMALSRSNPLAVKWYMLIVQGLVFAVIYYVVFRTVITALNLKTPGREEDVEKNAQTVGKTFSNHQERAIAFIDALGGKDNLTSIDACITRLRLTLANIQKVDKNKLRLLGSKGNVKLGNNAFQVILGPEAEFIADAMKSIK